MNWWNLQLRRLVRLQHPAQGAEVQGVGRPLIHTAAPTRDRSQPDIIDAAVAELLAGTDLYYGGRR